MATHTRVIKVFRARNTFHITRAIGLLGSTALMLGCGLGNDLDPGVQTQMSASVSSPQTPLDGTTLPRFVDPLPTFNGRRVNGTPTVQANMQEFQQKILNNS